MEIEPQEQPISIQLFDCRPDFMAEAAQKAVAEIMPDHVHFLLNAPTHELAADIARWIKGRGSKILREEFPSLKKLPSLWGPSYFVATTGQVSTDTVRKYIEGQKGK